VIKFSAETPSGPLFGFGLSRGNIDRLTAGQPIKINLRDLGGPAVNIAIMFGETEQALFDELKAAGAISPDTVYHAAAPGMTEVVRMKRPGTEKPS